MITTLHLLRGGRPLCGFSKDYPREWPEDNRWRPFDWSDGGLTGRAGILTMQQLEPKSWKACEGCVAEAKKLLEKGSK